MTINQVKLLIELYKNGLNLSIASEKLNIVQSAGSRQLKLLEEELGFPIFIRKANRLAEFTQAGEQVLEQAKMICLAERNIKMLSDSFNPNMEGSIRLGTTHTQARYILPNVLMNYKTKHPQTKLHIEESSPENLYSFLQRDQIDIAICSELISKQDDLVSQKAYEWEHVMIAPHNHPIWKRNLSIESCVNYPILSYIKGFTHSDKVLHALREVQPGFEFDIVASDADVIKTYVKNGFGIGIIAEMALEDLDAKHFKTYRLGAEVGYSSTYYAYLKKRFLPSYMEAFLDTFIKAVSHKFH
ncbi:HTH-type transcriptional regulator CysB [Hydrogenovibrio crunogenus]|uniref:HTH-type transcriptional regulator CysB n=1 Tax=Hydrogenovibrio crunogenus TaxID=39765 RepID=A0A4P7NYB2_9GAMM|nr:LysR substrate-binding domain-containing protein [Hydrogenovibrio crunogenus]QBZ82781.1 HTH-type transcriptional regulator CysB [Hydrogenovibrio crunogenus]